MSGVGNYGRRRDLSWTVAVLVTVMVVAFLGWLVFRSPADSGDALSTAAVTVAPSTVALVPVTIPDTSPLVDPAATTTTTTNVPTSEAPPETGDVTAITQPAAVESTLPPTTTAPDTSVDTPPITPPSSDDPSTTAGPVGGPSYPTLPDGSPVPVLGVYDGDVVTVSGNVPSQEVKDRLLGLALANSTSANPILDESVTINPDVPIQIGVRVFDADSVRFPDGSAEIRPDHALQLDRVLNIMFLFPDVEVLVVGHSDQRGTEEQNFAISRDRAQAVADYFVDKGVSPLRISSRAVGEADLLTESRDRAALALNRRTEFIFYGLLVG